MHIRITVECTDSIDELTGCLQSVRSWERARDEIKMTWVVDAPTISSGDMKAILSGLQPPLPIVAVTRARFQG